MGYSHSSQTVKSHFMGYSHSSRTVKSHFMGYSHSSRTVKPLFMDCSHFSRTKIHYKWTVQSPLTDCKSILLSAQSRFMDCSTLKIEALTSFETPVTIYDSIRRNSSEDPTLPFNSSFLHPLTSTRHLL